MFDYSKIDRAARAGFDTHQSGSPMPSWVVKDQLLVDAWSAGRRQAADKARTPKIQRAHDERKD